jgi:beta-lactamase class D
MSYPRIVIGSKETIAVQHLIIEFGNSTIQSTKEALPFWIQSSLLILS